MTSFSCPCSALGDEEATVVPSPLPPPYLPPPRAQSPYLGGDFHLRNIRETYVSDNVVEKMISILAVM